MLENNGRRMCIKIIVASFEAVLKIGKSHFFPIQLTKKGIAKNHRRKTVHIARSEEHTSELQSRETISYAVFCLKKKKTKKIKIKKKKKNHNTRNINSTALKPE